MTPHLARSGGRGACDSSGSLRPHLHLTPRTRPSAAARARGHGARHRRGGGARDEGRWGRPRASRRAGGGGGRGVHNAPATEEKPRGPALPTSQGEGRRGRALALRVVGEGAEPGGRAGPERDGRCPVPSHARAAAGWAARAPVESLTYAVDELVAPRVQFLPKAASLNGALLPPTHPRHLLPPARPCLRRGPAHAQPRRPGPRTHPWPGRRAFRRGRRGGKAALTSPWPRGGPGWSAPPPGRPASPRTGSASHCPAAPERRLPTPALGARAALALQQGHGCPGPPRGFWFLN